MSNANVKRYAAGAVWMQAHFLRWPDANGMLQPKRRSDCAGAACHGNSEPFDPLKMLRFCADAVMFDADLVADLIYFTSAVMKTTFTKLNEDWNAEPNAPDPKIGAVGKDILLSFYLNPFQFPQFEEDDVGVIRFKNCFRYRLGPENDEGWYRGQCRFSKLAPAWGEFYEVSGDLKLAECPLVWKTISPEVKDTRHFLFYFRDNMFECDAQEWQFEPTANNSLHPTSALTRRRG